MAACMSAVCVRHANITSIVSGACSIDNNYYLKRNCFFPPQINIKVLLLAVKDTVTVWLVPLASLHGAALHPGMSTPVTVTPVVSACS